MNNTFTIFSNLFPWTAANLYALSDFNNPDAMTRTQTISLIAFSCLLVVPAGSMIISLVLDGIYQLTFCGIPNLCHRKETPIVRETPKMSTFKKVVLAGVGAGILAAAAYAVYHHMIDQDPFNPDSSHHGHNITNHENLSNFTKFTNGAFEPVCWSILLSPFMVLGKSLIYDSLVRRPLWKVDGPEIRERMFKIRALAAAQQAALSLENLQVQMFDCVSNITYSVPLQGSVFVSYEVLANMFARQLYEILDQCKQLVQQKNQHPDKTIELEWCLNNYTFKRKFTGNDLQRIFNELYRIEGTSASHVNPTDLPCSISEIRRYANIVKNHTDPDIRSIPGFKFTSFKNGNICTIVIDIIGMVEILEKIPEKEWPKFDYIIERDHIAQDIRVEIDLPLGNGKTERVPLSSSDLRIIITKCYNIANGNYAMYIPRNDFREQLRLN